MPLTTPRSAIQPSTKHQAPAFSTKHQAPSTKHQAPSTKHLRFHQLKPENQISVPRVAFVTSHPIQYHVPVFRCLAARTDIEFIVLFAMLPDASAKAG
jgi:hypothetical protein